MSGRGQQNWVSDEKNEDWKWGSESDLTTDDCEKAARVGEGKVEFSLYRGESDGRIGMREREGERERREVGSLNFFFFLFWVEINWLF